MPSYPIRPTFPIDVRSTPTIAATRVGTAFRFDVVPGSIPTNPGGLPAPDNTMAPDADYTAKSTDTFVSFPALTAARTFYLPSLISYPVGQDLVVSDGSGMCSAALPILLVPLPGTGDQIGNGTPIALTQPYQALRLRRGGGNLWILA